MSKFKLDSVTLEDETQAVNLVSLLLNREICHVWRILTPREGGCGGFLQLPGCFKDTSASLMDCSCCMS